MKLLSWLKGARTTVAAGLPRVSLLICLLALAGCGVVGTLYLLGERQVEALRTDFGLTHNQLRRSGTEESRQAQLQNARAGLAAAQQNLPQLPDGTGTLEAVLQVARESGVVINDLKLQLGKAGAAGQQGYVMLSISLQMRGSVAALGAFLGRLESGAAGAVVVGQLNVSGVQESPTGSVSLSVHARP